MRHGTSSSSSSSSSRRQRGRGNGGGRRNNNGGGNSGQRRTQVYDSNGPDVRIRGTAHQVHEKYLTLSKDSTSAGDIVLAESYMQHAEHYQRIINSWIEDAPAKAVPVRSETSETQGKTKSEGNRARPKDDLALPCSILGEDHKVKAVKGVQKESTELSDA